jgi:cysteine desulfurase
MQKRIYLDYAAATPLDSQVKKAMEPFWDEHFGNAGGIYQEGVYAKKVLDESRNKVANLLGAKSEEIVFTASGTESNSLAIIGLFNFLEEKNLLKGSHIITSTIEHPSVLEIFKEYEKKGLEVDFAPVDKEGILDLEVFKKLLKENTVFVSIMYVNNEIGTIQPVKEVSEIVKKFNEKIILHSDACQGPLLLDVNVNNLGVDLMSIDAQKIYGPKGVGALYVKKDIDIKPVIIGGSQEMGLRPGTENIPLIVGLATALEIVDRDREEVRDKILKLREYLLDKLLEIPGLKLNGNREKRIANNINISIEGQDSEYLVLALDSKGIACATKSACIRDRKIGSYVVQALDGEGGGGGLRFSLGRETTKEEADRVFVALSEILKLS